MQRPFSDVNKPIVTAWLCATDGVCKTSIYIAKTCVFMNCGSGEIPATGTRVPAAQHKQLSFTLLPVPPTENGE